MKTIDVKGHGVVSVTPDVSTLNVQCRVTALVEYVTDEGIGYVKVHHVIADGNFVFTLS
ncbi:hypothetical protein [Sorangium sp. So ce145]